ADGGFGLDDLALRWLQRKVDKGDDTWRLRYHLLRGLKLPEWPEAAKVYAKTDGRVTWDIFAAQQEWLGVALIEEAGDECRQAYSAWGLQLMKVWGVRTEPTRVAELERHLKRRTDRLLRVLVERKRYRWKGTKADPKRDGLGRGNKELEAD